MDALEKVLGTTKFAADYSLPGMLYGGVFRSTVPHATINNLNLEKARALDGVEAVLDYHAIPGKIASALSLKTSPVWWMIRSAVMAMPCRVAAKSPEIGGSPGAD